MASRRGVVTKAHQRSYDDPITLKKGDEVRITKRELWDDEYPWVWAINAEGKEGWVPETFIQGDEEQGLAKYDYNALEITVEEGETVDILEETNGWYWVTNATGNSGWVPITNITLL